MNQQPDQKNLILAIALSVGVLFLWQWLYAGPKLKEEQERRARIAQEQGQTAGQPAQPGTPSRPSAATPGSPGGLPQPTLGGQPKSQPAQAATREDALAASQRLPIETQSLKGSIALRGGRIDDLVLATYFETVNRGSPNVVLLSPSGAPDAYFTESGYIAPQGSGIAAPGPETIWTAATQGPLTSTEPAVLTFDNGQGLKFRRTISVDKDYMFTIRDEVENAGSAPVTLFPYGRVLRQGQPPGANTYVVHEGAVGFLGSEGLYPNCGLFSCDGKYSDLIKDGAGKTAAKQTSGWFGLTDKYWATVLIPDQKSTYTASLKGWKDAGKEYFQTDYLLEGVTLANGASSTIESRIFAGAKKVDLIERYKDSLQIPKFDLLVDWGHLYFITKPLFHLLEWIHKFVPNFGIAIMILTVLVRGAFFPLAQKSYESMAKMKKLQPAMVELRERYKDDKARQQQELMALYQKEKINPMAGCVPVLLQVPVFFALYKVLSITLDMRQAPFFGWIRDLSATDPTNLFTLFGLIHWAPPEYLHLGVWPMVMGVTMWVQMQMNPQQPDPTQQMVFNWMPVMFTFMMGSFAAGLVIYWTWSNILSIAQQYAIMKRQGVKVPLVENLGLDKLVARWGGRMSTSPAVATASGKSAAGKSSVPPPDKSRTNGSGAQSKTSGKPAPNGSANGGAANAGDTKAE